MIVYLDGEYLPRHEACIPVEDRGFLFGDGVYEVIRARDGVLFTAAEHLARLHEGLDALEIDANSQLSADRLQTIAETLLEKNDRLEGDATVYLQVTRGAATRTHAFPTSACRPTVFLASARFTHPPRLHDDGAAVITHPDVRWARCNLKTVNLLPNVIAKQRAVEAGAVEAVLVRDGVVTEGASTNVFAVVDGELRTYPACHYILNGVTRRVVIELAGEMDLPVRELPLRVEEMPDVDELFLTGTTTDVMPVVSVNGSAIADGRPGPIARRLQAGLQERIGAAVQLAS